VIAASILSSVPSEYAARPFVISGSCKRETVADQQRLLASASHLLQESQRTSGRRLYCIASDGDSRRRRALINMTLDRDLDANDPVSELLSLSLFNTRCGPDALTCDFDWKHVMKRFRNTDLRLKG